MSRAAAENQFFSLARTVRDNFTNHAARTDGLVASKRDQQRCHDIPAEEVRHILEGLTRGSGDGADVRPLHHLAETSTGKM